MPKVEAITLKQLRALSAVAAHGSITRAAEAIRLTPPAVHSQLKQLADNMSADLLRRAESGGMELTDEGQAVLEAARRIEIELEACVHSVSELRDGRAGHVQLGVVSTGKYFAPALVARLQREFPTIRVDLIIGNRKQIIAALDARQIQLAIMGRPPRFPPNNSEELGPHPHVLIAPPGHPLASKRGVDPEELLDETFLAREEGSGTRILMSRFLDRIGEGRIYNVTTMSSNETIKQAVRAGLGIAVISQHTVMEELRDGKLVALDVPGLPIERAWYLLTRSDVPLSPAADRIRAHISGMQGNFLPRLDPAVG